MKNLWNPIDNAPLIVFRIFFGFLIAAESFGAILTGWVRKVLVQPEFTFSHIGFEWLQPLPGFGMYGYFSVMGTMGIAVMLGYKYRWSLGIFTLLWTGVYLMQKEAYNNHYYLLILVCIIMLFLPANRAVSIDAKQNPKIKTNYMPKFVLAVMITQMAIVYGFATIAKFYPDWLDGTFTRNLFQPHKNFPFFGAVFSSEWFPLFIAYSGILFDGLIIPALLWKKTRTIAFIASLIFHLFNAVTLQIGIFPFFALSFVVFFYPPEKIRKLFFRNQNPVPDTALNLKPAKPILLFFILFFTLQLVLPIRHWFIKGDVLWTEEGHRLSWRMMLRQRNGTITYRIVDKQTKEQWMYPHQSKVTFKQYSLLNKPDGIWQYAQRIKKEYEAQGKDISIFIDSRVSVNNKPYLMFVDPAVDFAQAKWNYFSHNNWIIRYDSQGNPIEK
ncbi:HTTM domain-containing protein [Flavobacterium orientale]|uniref:Type I deoxyribonuclease HsdR n=1 Tax=Flavobacterium orientale TaxID=1756020 RepID=A0A916XWZ6_9FLAO|nr:HTTM domain-containing protein [Flavobacterium orientale]GGD18569.1 type I deoxyribonuclease HsdR [Flavobacterium orientale]